MGGDLFPGPAGPQRGGPGAGAAVRGRRVPPPLPAAGPAGPAGVVRGAAAAGLPVPLRGLPLPAGVSPGGRGPGVLGAPVHLPVGGVGHPGGGPAGALLAAIQTKPPAAALRGALLVVFRKFPGTASLGSGPPSRLPCDAFPTEKVAAGTLENGFPAATSGTPGWIRTSGLPLRSSKKLGFNRVPACPVMSEKPWNIKDFR